LLTAARLAIGTGASDALLSKLAEERRLRHEAESGNAVAEAAT
jgi:hypothetical protein